jgi:hypothetical protein
VECKLRCINFRRVSDLRRAFRPAFRVTGISDDCYRSTIGVIVICLGTRLSARENCGCTWEHLGAPAMCMGAPTTSLGAPGSAGVKSGCAGGKSGCAGDKSECANDKPWSAGGKSRSISNHSRAVWEKQHFPLERCRCTWK